MADPTESKTPATPPVTQVTPPAPPPAQAPPIQAAPPAPPPAPQGPQAHQLGDDGDIPENAELLSLSKKALNTRLERHTNKQLRERFGTDNPDEIKTKLDKLATFEKQQEEQRLAALTSEQRLQEQVNKERERGDRYKQRYQQTVEQQVFTREQTRIESIATRLVDPQFLQYEFQNLARYLQATYSEEELKQLPDQKIEEWFSNRIKEVPKLARDFSTPPPAPRTAPLNNGPRSNDRPPPPQGPQNGRTNYSPSGPNAMSRDEARAKARSEGYDY